MKIDTSLKTTIQAALALTLVLPFLGCSNKPAQESGLDQVTLMLNWYPEAEHGGFYAAQVNGIFEKYGLEVTLKPGGPNAPVAQELLTGRVEFAIGNADDVLLFCQQDANVVALLAPIQDTPRCILVRESSEVDALTKLAGLTLQANAGRPFVDYMQAEGLLDGVQIVPYPGTVTGFVADENTAIQAYSFSEPLLAKQQGIEPRLLMLSEAGFNPYASCLITTGDYIEANEDMVQRMVSACREGWQAYLQDSDAANEAILADNQHGMTKEALDFGADQLRPLCLTSNMSPESIGQMKLERWETLVEQFVKLKLVDSDSVKAQDVFDVRFMSATDEAE
ncbi:MAG: ABC transporter substrate-binding protein [Aureliella sp.]